MKFDPAPGKTSTPLIRPIFFFQPIVDRINGVPLYTCMYEAVFPTD